MSAEPIAREGSCRVSPLRIFQPWSDKAGDCCCVATRFSWKTDRHSLHDTPDMDIPTRLIRAAPRRMAEYIAGRRCAGEALRLLSGRTSFPGQAEDRAPIWPQGFVGSISHSGEHAIAVVGRSDRYRGMGIDLERRLTVAEGREIAPQAMTAQEQRRLGGESDPFIVGLTFSAKESLFKALYPTVRRFFYFNSAELVAWDAEGMAVLRLTDDLSPEWRRGRVVAAQYFCIDGLLMTRVSIELGCAAEEVARFV